MAPVWLSEAELAARFGSGRVDRFADRDGDGSADSGTIESAIVRAESRTRAKLLTRFQPDDLPASVEAASGLLKEIVGGFAIYNLTEHCELRGEDIVQAERNARATLDDVCKGESSLLLAGSPAKDLSAPQILEARRDTVYGTPHVGSGDKGSLSASIRDW